MHREGLCSGVPAPRLPTAPGVHCRSHLEKVDGMSTSDANPLEAAEKRLKKEIYRHISLPELPGDHVYTFLYSKT